MRRGEIALSAGLLAIGLAAAAITASLPAEGGYARIGPNIVPAIVAAGLIVVALWLLYEALSGGWRRAPEHAARFHAAPFLWVSAGLLAHMALIGRAGFVLAGCVLFSCVARGFGSTRPVRDFLVGVALAAALYFFFTHFLGVSLPAGWMSLPR